MENATLAIDLFPIISNFLKNNELDKNIILIKTTDNTLQDALMDYFSTKVTQASCAREFETYQYALRLKPEDRNKKIFHILLNPTDWDEWEEGDIIFSKESNVSTIILDNSFTASCMADEIWEIDNHGNTKKLACPDFF